MINLQLQTSTGTQPIQLPTSWADITFNQFLDLHEIGFTNVQQVVEYFTGNFFEFSPQVYQLLDFIFSPENILSEQPACDIRIAHQSWEKFEMAKAAIEQAEGDPVLFGKQLVEIYSHQDIGPMSVPEAVGWISFFFHSLPLSWKDTVNFKIANLPDKKRWLIYFLMDPTTLSSSVGRQRFIRSRQGMAVCWYGISY